MDKEQLLALARLSRLSPEELAEEDPAVFAAVAAKAAGQLKERLVAQLTAVSPEAREALDALPLDLTAAADPRESLLAALAGGAMPEPLRTELTEKVLGLEASPLLDNPLEPGVPLAQQPLVQPELAAAGLQRVIDVARLPQRLADELLAPDRAPVTLTDDVLRSLVEAGTLGERDAAALGLATSVLALVDDDAALAQAVAAFASPRLPDGRVSGIRDLAVLTPGDWAALVEASGATLAPGTTAADRGAELAGRVARLFPTDVLLTRLRPDRERVTAMVAGGDREGLGKLANAFPGLGIVELATEPAMSNDERAAAISSRLDAVTRLRDLNPDVDLLALDLSADSEELRALRSDGVSGEDMARVVGSLKAQQRVLALTDDVEHARLLLEAGYSSALKLARTDLGELAAATGLDVAAAGGYRREAATATTAVIGIAGAMLDASFGGFDWLQVANMPPPTQDYVRRLDGYAQLFGSQAYCNCEHCQSILSPAAYFVDLMRFVETAVADSKVFAARPNHPMHLKVRRPDLWTTPLTCANTTTLVPTLDLVNEILENYLARSQGFAGNLADRAAVANAVYRELLSGATDTPREPFVLPLHRIDAYLGQLETSRAEIARALGNAAKLPEAILGLSAADVLLITTEQQIGFLRDVLDLPLPLGNDGRVTPFDVQELVASLGVSRDELGRLAGARFVAAGAPVRIVSEKTDADSVQNDIERVRDLTPASLDRLHRLYRLRRHLPWSVGELDLVLTHARVTTLTEPELAAVAGVLAVQRRLGTSLEETCALAGDLPRVPAGDGPSLFDRLFNPLPFVVQDGRYPKDTVNFVHPALRDAPAGPPDATAHRLQAALGVDDETLLVLIRGLAGQLGADLDAQDDDDRGFALTVANLSLLYRYARLARLARMRAGDLLRLLGLVPGLTDGFGVDAAGLEPLLDFLDWFRSSGYDTDDLAMIRRRPPLDQARAIDAGEVVRALLDEVAAEQALTFADTVFAFLDGVTEADSRRLMAANQARIRPSADGRTFRLAADFDLDAALTVPQGVTVDAPAARRLLARYHPSQVLPARLAGRLGLDVEKTAALLALVGADLSSGALPRALHGDGPSDPLVTLVGDIVPLRVLFKQQAFDADATAFVADHRDMFGLTDLADIGLDAARNARRYVTLATPPPAPSQRQRPPATPAELRNVLDALDQGQGPGAADPAELGRVLAVEPGVLATIASVVTLPGLALEALERLAGAVRLARRIGVGGAALGGTLANDYDQLHAAADALLAALRARYPESQWPDRIEPLEDVVRSAKRDALSDHLLRSTFPQFTRREDLYQHFLIDVELEGCARTSRVVAAISSVQLYVHRVLMNLEQDRRDPSDPDHVHVPPTIFDPDEWAWRKNYRVWEANRKVFLWPENYLEPELRDDKTPLFEELESTLLQQPIDEQTVLDAYAAYLAGFEELSRIQIAGSFHEKDTKTRTDTLHLFGVTSSDPPTFWYRTARNLHYGALEPGRVTEWSPWRKLDVQISARKVSPIVFDGRLHVFWVDYVTKPRNVVSGGASTFAGYSHTTVLHFTTLRLDGTWTPPQRLAVYGLPAFVGDGVLIDPLLPSGRPMHDGAIHGTEPREGYTLQGVRWERPYPFVDRVRRLQLSVAGFSSIYQVDLFARRLTPATFSPAQTGDQRLLHVPSATPRSLRQTSAPVPALEYDTASRWLDQQRTDLGFPNVPQSWDWLQPLLSPTPVLGLPATAGIEVVNGSLQDAIVDDGGDLLLLQGSVRPAPAFVLRRIGTTLGTDMARLLFTAGVDGLLSLATQRSLGERAPRLTNLNQVESQVRTGTIDFTGPYGVYFREIFFHIPFLLADHLNAQGRFAAAQRWYSYIFDPTANEPAPQAQRDRNWRYLELRGLDVPKLRQVLTDPAAIAAYRSDPFNPHAIARLRLSAYAKRVVMKYVDNLLDWADDLFAQFTTESVNEATMLYAMAAAILGDRPPALGSCGEGTISPKTYEQIAPLLREDSDFLVELESWLHGKIKAQGVTKASAKQFTWTLAPAAVRQASSALSLEDTATPLADGGTPLGSFFTWKQAKAASWTSTGTQRQAIRLLDPGFTLWRAPGTVSNFGLALFSTSPVFCIAGNRDLLAYWDRVADRLHKIRNCMDITGARRQPALFAPEIDPGLLVSARAAGLGLDEVLNAISGDLPPYRFSYLIDRAKAHAATVQAFGAALLAALEKKDMEQLNQLRVVQQQNLLKLTTRVRQWEIDAAQDVVEALERQSDAAAFRRDHYLDLIRNGLTPWETAQSVSRHTATLSFVGAALLRGSGGILTLLPQLGSPFAMKYGGVELGTSADRWAKVFADTASIAETISASAAIEAGFERRSQGWQHQADLAQRDIDALTKQIEAAKVRVSIANRSMEIHQATLDQLDELSEFYADKLTGLGLYTWLSGTLRRIHREAYNGAYAMARLAEQAYRLERSDQSSDLLSPTYWEASHAGLLAGERLLIDLQAMERRFLETNYRGLEVDQALSLTQLDPAALVQLRETGTCEFTIPELFYDLYYPGHYRRQIKSVRLTIPCVTGPYTNVSATLTLLGSRLRSDQRVGNDALVDVPLRRSVSIATSTAQQDAGVFELSFRDERYMPFEKAGAISDWRLSLPRTFKPFDYRTITDVIMHVTYTAEADELLRQTVEDRNADVEGSLRALLTDSSLTRVFSLRSDFSGVFSRLLHSPVGTEIRFTLASQHLPLFLPGGDLEATAAKVALVPADDQAVGDATLRLGTTDLDAFTDDAALGGLPSADAAAALVPGFLGEHTLTVVDAGELGIDQPVPGDLSALDAAKLSDVLIVVDYKLKEQQPQ